MQERPIEAVHPLQGYVLRIDFASGSSVMLHMEDLLTKVRFIALREQAVWNGAVTDGTFVRWPGVCELAFDEVVNLVTGY